MIFSRDNWKKLKKNKTAMFGLVIIVLSLLLALFAYMIAPDNTVNAKPDAGGSAFFTQTKDAAASGATTFTITGSTTNILNMVTITVTSKSCATNTATGNYKFTRK